MAWRLAKSLVTLRDQINQAYPNRSKASDGTIGDPAHASRPSDHNPNAQGVVCALDLTHDPAHGFDAHALAEIQRQNPHPNLKYIVSNSRIASRKHGWVWRSYTGSNPHSKHVHFSVGIGSDGQSKQPYDDTTPWQITKGNIMVLNWEEINRLHLTYFQTPAGETDKAFIGKTLIEYLNVLDKDVTSAPAIVNSLKTFIKRAG